MTECVDKRGCYLEIERGLPPCKQLHKRGIFACGLYAVRHRAVEVMDLCRRQGHPIQTPN